MMEQLRQLPPWQIIVGAAAILVVFLVGGYFLITALTNVPPAQTATSKIPANLDSASNKKVVKKLDAFEAPSSLPILTEPLRTPDPNAPSSVNPFQ